jgi:hypothetical protein
MQMQFEREALLIYSIYITLSINSLSRWISECSDTIKTTYLEEKNMNTEHTFYIPSH